MASGFALTRSAGWLLAALGFAIAVLAGVLRAVNGGDLSEPLVLAFMVTFFLGMLLVAITSGIRIFRGDVRLRPLNAARSALMIFGLIIVCHLVAMAFVPKWQPDWIEVMIRSLAMAVGIGLYTTAYRKPA